MALIDIGAIAELFNELLGSEFNVRMDNLTELENSNKIPCVIKAARIPFAIEDIGSESLEITLTAKLNVDNDIIKHEQLYKFTKIIGSHRGEIFDGNGNRFRFNLYLKGHAPVTDAVFDINGECNCYEMSASLLISDVESGAILSSDIVYELSDKPFDDESRISGKLAVTSIDTDPNHMTENRNSCNSGKLKPVLKASALSLSINALVCNKTIDKVIIDRIENGLGGIFYLKKTYLEKIKVFRVELVGGKILGQGGAYEQFQLLLQEVENG